MEPPAPGPAHRAAVAAAVLAFCCLCWGLSFPLMQLAMGRSAALIHDRAGADLAIGDDLAMRATFCGWRFAMAALLYAALTARRQRGFTRADLVGGTLVGASFAAALLLQIVGLRYVLPSISAVLTSLAVVFVPIVQAGLLRRAVGVPTWIATAVALAGIAVLSLPNPGAIAGNTHAGPAPLPWLGQALTVGAALLFTIQLLALDRHGPRADTARLTLVMFAVSAVVGLAVGAAAGGAGLSTPAVLGVLVADAAWLSATLAMVALSSVLAFHLMNGWQPALSPAVAAVVYCLEPVFATACSVAFGTERITAVTICGGALVLGAVLLATRASAARG